MTRIDDFTEISFNAVPRAITAMELAAENAGLSRTDTLNRAIQLYAAITRRPLWTALRIVWRERATVRRFAAEPRCQEPTCPDYGDPDFGEATCLAEHAEHRTAAGHPAHTPGDNQ